MFLINLFALGCQNSQRHFDFLSLFSKEPNGDEKKERENEKEGKLRVNTPC